MVRPRWRYSGVQKVGENLFGEFIYEICHQQTTREIKRKFWRAASKWYKPSKTRYSGSEKRIEKGIRNGGEVGEVIVLRVPGKRDLVNWKKINQVLELNGYLLVGFF